MASNGQPNGVESRWHITKKMLCDWTGLTRSAIDSHATRFNLSTQSPVDLSKLVGQLFRLLQQYHIVLSRAEETDDTATELRRQSLALDVAVKELKRRTVALQLAEREATLVRVDVVGEVFRGLGRIWQQGISRIDAEAGSHVAGLLKQIVDDSCLQSNQLLESIGERPICEDYDDGPTTSELAASAGASVD